MTEGIAQPLLTIAIPTWNRASFLALTLKQLAHEGCNDWGAVEVLVSDNASTDGTARVVADVVASGMPVRYIRNSDNVGSDANIAQCFNCALGSYVLILGDDDLLMDGALELLLAHLASQTFGVVCLRPYGFDSDFRQEYPGLAGKERVYSDAGIFLASIGPLMTLISSCVIHKSRLPHLDARKFCGDNLVQVHLVLRAALAAKKNMFFERYLVACRRNNSGGYDFSQVFVSHLGAVLDSCKPLGLTQGAIESIEGRLILSYYPFYLLRQRLAHTGPLNATLATFQSRFQGRAMFVVWLRPILCLPRPFAIVWGALTTLIGRLLNGDLRLGVAFAWNRVIQKGQNKSKPNRV